MFNGHIRSNNVDQPHENILSSAETTYVNLSHCTSPITLDIGPSTSKELVPDCMLPPKSTSSAIADPSTLKEALPAYILPTQILPLPTRNNTSLRRRKGKESTILTSSPVKDEMEDALQRKREEQKNKGKRNVFGLKQNDNGENPRSVSAGNTKDKAKAKKIQTSFEKKIETKHLKHSENSVTCPGCEETFLETPNDD